MPNDDTILDAASSSASPAAALSNAASPRIAFPGDAPPPDPAIVPVEGPANAQPARPEEERSHAGCGLGNADRCS